MATRASLAEAPPGQGAGRAPSRAMSISEMLWTRENLKNAQREDPLLGSPVGATRRRAVLGQINAELEGRGRAEHAHAIELTRSMTPSSVAEAWDGLYAELLRLGEEAMAEAAANEARGARAEAWQSMRNDGDIISQVVPMGEQFIASHASSVNRYRQKVATMAGFLRPFRLGREMEDHVVNMARFGSLADDWMTRVIIDELYLERGMYEEVCGICERILGFEGYDRHRMMASTLVEDILSALLGHLERCEEPGYADHLASRGMPVSPRCGDKERLEGLKKACLDLLVRRAESLGLEIRPSGRESGLLRKASDYALKVSARRTIRPAGEIVEYARANYPESYAFLRLGGARAAGRMAKSWTQLAENISVQMELERIARIQNVDPPTNNALEALEPMLRFMRDRDVKVKDGTLKKWRKGMLGDQLWDYVFEMDVYLRLVRANAGVEADVEIPKVDGKGKAEIDLRVDGCLAEVYAPLDKEILVHRHATRIEDPGAGLVDAVLKKGQLGHVGKNRTVVIAKCSGGDFGNIGAVRDRMEARLAGAAQPGAVFFVRDGAGSYAVECLVNRNAAEAVPEETLQKIHRALELESL